MGRTFRFSAPELPWPAEWRTTNRSWRWKRVWFAAGSVPLVVGGIWALPLRGGWLSIELGIFCALVIFAPDKSRVAEFRIGTTEIVDGPPPRTFTPRKQELYCGKVAGHIVGIVLCASFLLAVPFSAVLEGPSGRHSGLLSYIAMPFVIGLLIVRLWSRFLMHRHVRLGLGLSKEGVHFGSWWGETRIYWKHIAYIEVVRNETRQSSRSRVKNPPEVCGIDIILNDRGLDYARGNVPNGPVRYWGPVIRQLCKINAVELDAHPSLLAQLPKFYLEHPELRGELGTEKSVERIRTGNFVA